MIDALIWFVVVELLGLLTFPLAFTLFRRLPDRGYSLTKPLALILASYLLWVLGLTHLISNSRPTIITIILVGVVASFLVLRQQHQKIWAFFRREKWGLIVAEVLFVGFFLFWLAIISEVPAINHTEKPMDFALLNAIEQSRYFPPEDPWLAGHSISYYYFGYLVMALVTKLTGIPSNVSYNLAVALIPALVGAGSFGLLYNLVRLSQGGRGTAIRFGLLAPVLMLVIGNLEGVLELLQVRGWGGQGFWQWVGIKGLEGMASDSSGIFPDQQWWWWRATRVIDTLADGRSLDYTITEFPFFSFILGDLHPHVMSLPFLLLNLSLLLNLWLSPEKLGLRWLIHHWGEGLAIMMCLGALAFINAWDFPVFAAILGVLVLVKKYSDQESNLWQAIQVAASLVLPIVLGAVVLFSPFYLSLSSQASGILPLREVSTRPFLFLLVLGLFFVLGVSFLLRQMPRLPRPTWGDIPALLLVIGITLTPFLLWAIIELLLGPFDDGLISAGREVGKKFLWLMPGMVIVGLAGSSAVLRVRQVHPHPNPPPSSGKEEGSQGLYVVVFPLLLLAVAFYLLVGAELFYVTDLFGNRMNTVFKIYYQSWLLLAVVGAYGVYYWWKSGVYPHPSGSAQDRPDLPHRRREKLSRIGYYTWVGMLAVLLVVSLYYPVGAVLDRTGLFQQGHTLEDNTLDGLAFLRASDPGEYAAIQWLRDQAPWGRLVEAVGGDYSDYGRISASTGLPTVLGWKGHEHQWRGTTRIFQGRETDVAQIYQGGDIELVRHLLERYDVRYVYVGRREQASYGSERLSRFGGFMKTVFEQDGVIIYER